MTDYNMHKHYNSNDHIHSSSHAVGQDRLPPIGHESALSKFLMKG